MRVLIACEFSGVVRNAFLKKGHDAWSCDLIPSESEPYWRHFQSDIKNVLWFDNPKWDLMIAHPPCTHLAVSGARWFKDKRVEQQQALDFIKVLLDAPIDKICLENPVGIISTR